MATRSIIAVKNTNDTYDAIYCHWDGHPDGVGKTLRDNYRTCLLAHELIGRGDLSSLGPSIESSQFYTSKGEDLKKHYADNMEELKNIASGMWAEYLYVFEDDKWSTVEI